MNKQIIEVGSKWTDKQTHKWITQNGNKLVVLLPGAQTTCESPLLYYSMNVALDLGYDALAIGYGFQKAQVKIDSSSYETVVSEIEQVIHLTQSYESIIIIAKSFGTHFIEPLKSKFYVSKAVYLTPVDNSVPCELLEEDLFVFGTKDPLISQDNKDKLLLANALQVDNGNHGLKVGCTSDNIQALNRVIARINLHLSE